MQYTSGYKATLCGRIIGKRGRHLVTFPKSNGYYCFSQSDGRGNPNQTLVHRFVWSFWKGDIPDGVHVDHIDGDKSNNSIYNLQLLTPQENSGKSALVLTQKQAESIRKSTKSGADLSLEFGISQQLICCIRKGRKYNTGYGKEAFDDRGKKRCTIATQRLNKP